LLARWPGAVLLADGKAMPTTTIEGAALYGHDLAGNVLNLLKLAPDGAAADGAAPVAAITRLAVVSRMTNLDGAANLWNRTRGNPDGALQTYRPATLFAFVAGGANAIATMTLPLAGAGLFHYVTYLRISRVATAALAGGAILTVTTTNFGNHGWRTGNLMVAGGTTDLVNMAFPFPFKSAGPNTATTFVGPAAGAAVSWDMECEYFVGP